MKAVIFDLDGTLLDTLTDLATAGNQALMAQNLLPLPKTRYKYLVGSGAAHLCRQAAAESAGIPPDQVSDDLSEKILRSFKLFYDQGWNKETKLYPGIDIMLDALSHQKIPMAVLSNKPDAFTQKIVRHYFKKNLFQVVYGQHEMWPKKPDPALALEICRQMGVSPRETALAGDSGSDMRTAVNGGLVPVGVLWGFRLREELTEGGARCLAEDSTSLLHCLTGEDTPCE